MATRVVALGISTMSSQDETRCLKDFENPYPLDCYSFLLGAEYVRHSYTKKSFQRLYTSQNDYVMPALEDLIFPSELIPPVSIFVLARYLERSVLLPRLIDSGGKDAYTPSITLTCFKTACTLRLMCSSVT